MVAKTAPGSLRDQAGMAFAPIVGQAATVWRRIGLAFQTDGHSERRAIMTVFKPHLATLAVVLAGCASALHAQVPTIRTVEIMGPETETISVRAVCFSRTFSFAIVNNRFKPSVLIDARVGRTKANAQSTAALRHFLKSVRNVRVGSSQCVSKNEIGIGLYGLLRSPPQGQRDDVIRIFRISFGPDQ